MPSNHFAPSSKIDETSPGPTLLKIPRLVSLQHRLEHAKDIDGEPNPLGDELLFFLDDPPAGTTDRWQAGADLCESHGIKTSRMTVWRFYRANILQWRREQLPPPPPAPVDPEEIHRLQQQAHLLAAQRLIEMLNDPRLTPGQLIGLMQNENLRQQLQLARSQFHERLGLQRRNEQREERQRKENLARAQAMFPHLAAAHQKAFAPSGPVELHTTR